MRSARSGLRLWLLAFGGFFLLHAAWSFAAPYDGPPDEWAHALRAAAVAHGELLPNDYVQDTPKSLWKPISAKDIVGCFEMDVTVAADCATEPGGDQSLAPHKVSAAYYNPVYYAVTGWPLAVWPNWTGILLARLLTGAAMAALLASAVVAACRWTTNRAVLAGMVVAISPMAVSLGGAINPNGVEIAAGVALFAGLIPLLLERRDGINPRAVALVGVSASVLVTVRALGPVWLGLVFLTMLIGVPWAHLRALARARSVRVWAAVLTIATVAAIGWSFVARPLHVTSGDLGMSTKQVLRYGIVDAVWPNVANQMVGVTGWSELLQPRLIYVVWFMAVGLLLLGGFTTGDRVSKFRLLFLFVGTFVPLLGWELLRANDSGWFNQGRYFLPAAVGLPILGAYVLGRSGLAPAALRSITRTLAVLLLPIQLVVLAYTMCRWQSGLKILNPLKGSWMPPLGPALPLVAGVLGVLVLLVMYWRASRVGDARPDTPAETATTTREDEPQTDRVLSTVS